MSVLPACYSVHERADGKWCWRFTAPGLDDAPPRVTAESMGYGDKGAAECAALLYFYTDAPSAAEREGQAP